VESQVVTVEIINKKNMKHCYLKVLRKDFIEIKAHRFFSLEDAQFLLEDKKTWLLKQIIKHQKNELQEDEFLYFGKVEDKSLYKIKKLDEFYRKNAKEYLPCIIENFSNKMQLFPTNIKYRKNKNTWGSCNIDNQLSFNILLIKFPLEVIEYVVIHELAHIKHKNHSKKFWDLVEKYCPDYKQREEKLKSFL
jgi:predicted metal-dependent hydrolase